MTTVYYLRVTYIPKSSHGADVILTFDNEADRDNVRASATAAGWAPVSVTVLTTTTVDEANALLASKMAVHTAPPVVPVQVPQP